MNFIAPSADTYYLIVESQLGIASVDPFDQVSSLDPESVFELHFHLATCGNAVVEVGEECDDGDAASGDGCASTCTTEGGYLCENHPGQASSCFPAATDSCSTITTFPAEFAGTNWELLADDFTFDGSGCSAVSGEGFEMTFEVNLVEGETLRVRQLADVDTVLHILPGANCATIEGGASPACGASADFNEFAGVSYTALGDGPVVVAVVAYGLLSLEPFWPYRIVMDKSTCGNGAVEFAESCDDGNVTGGDGCSATCTTEPGFECAPSPPLACTQCAMAGATVVNTLPSELNNLYQSVGGLSENDFAGGVGCTVPNPDVGEDVVFQVTVAANQTVRLRETNPAFDAVLHIIAPPDCDGRSDCVADVDGSEYTSTESVGITFTAAQAGDVYLVVESKDKESLLSTFDVLIDGWACGDLVAHESEPCDDGNTVNGDGCSSSCGVEVGYRCEGSPSQCFDITSCTTLSCILECAGNCPCPGALVSGSYTGSDTVPDEGEVEVAINLISPNPTVTRLATSWSVLHPFDGDLRFSLRGPADNERDLCSNNGGNGNNFIDTQLVDGVAVPITAGASPFTSVFRPETPLSRFAGEAANGSWTLRVADSAAEDQGTLQSFDIVACVE